MKRIASVLSCLLLPLCAHAALPNCPTIAIEPTSLGGGSVGDAYTANLSQTGAANPAFSISAGSLPGGLTLGADGSLLGKPTQTGTFIFTAMATDPATGCGGGRVYAISVIQINHAPQFQAAGQSVLEDAGPQTIDPAFSNISDGDGGSQTLSFSVTGNSNPALFSSGPAISPTGALSFTPAPNANGSASITVVLQDNGGTANGGVDTSAPQTFPITVVAVNDAPVFSLGGNPSVPQNAGPQNIAGFASGIGDGDDGSQNVSFAITGNTNAALFSAGPAIAANGSLSFTTLANASGTATVSVQAQDDGGTGNGGVDTSAPQSFSITVTPVNHAPTFTVGSGVTVLEDAGPQTRPNYLGGIGDGDAGTQSVGFTITNNTNAGLFNSGPAIAANGTLSFTTKPNANGNASITVVAQDNGGTANGGVDTSAPQSFAITVTPVDDPPSAVGDSATVDQDSGANDIFVLSNDTDVDGGPKSIQSVTQPAHGVVVITGGGTGLTYAPNAGYSNDPPTVPADTFTYTINGGSTATVSITVTPAANPNDVGAYHLDGSCGILGVLGPGFTLTAGPAQPLPVGTAVVITGSGVANIGVFSVSGGTASVSVLSATSRQIMLTSALPAGATMAFRTTLSISVAFTLNGVTSLPSSFNGTGAKPTGSVSSTLILCSTT